MLIPKSYLLKYIPLWWSNTGIQVAHFVLLKLRRAVNGRYQNVGYALLCVEAAIMPIWKTTSERGLAKKKEVKM